MEIAISYIHVYILAAQFAALKLVYAEFQIVVYWVCLSNSDTVARRILYFYIPPDGKSCVAG